jgi:hypothetical protein
MLDWTTSFLSDALIIKPEIAICQTLSQAIQRMGIEEWQHYNRWIIGFVCLKRKRLGPYGIREGGGTIATDVERRSVAA